MFPSTTLLLAALLALSLTPRSAAPAAPSAPDAALSRDVTATSSALSPAAPAARAENAPSFSGAAALQHVEALSVGIGSRPAGSDVQARTRDYLVARYQELGYQTELQPFTITAYQDRGSSVVLGGPLGQGVPANTLQYSAAGVVEGELVEAGLGRAEDYEDAGARGKVALVTRGDTRFADKVEAGAQAGALAVIIVNNQPGNFNGSLIGMASIPAVSVSQADGATLRQAIRAGGASARVDVNASNEQSTGVNVVATRPGGPQTLVIGGHIDSVAAGPGANDNASGTAVTLELARVMATRPTPYTLQFVGFDAEEIGLVGSSSFVSRLSEEQRRAIVAMVNLDMVGVGDSSLVGGSEQLMRLAEAAGARAGLSLGRLGDGGGSDHASFMRAGIPALFVYRSNDPNYHSPNDQARYVDPANLQIAGQLVLDVVEALERGG
jgi:Zn-dependent M28 family amino/carboxypeptidase